ncbi:hypothetical protein [Hymenobacter guriensis]|uniref:NERD domain-containing protein n=1 Tax=Hymenobacter guriensis TaxID=2793065 RepID=A0ABS0L0N2_9BACT|nr:hypothetical protein [Hymenobacter guriensis]MBG8552989.1 hypothetical protein [Hymenobacter guriensis]
MIALIQEKFPSRIATPCVSSHTDTEFHVYDPPLTVRAEGDTSPIRRQPCSRRIGEPQEADLKVSNPQAHIIHLVAIDACSYLSDDATRCDCALVRDQDIRFVEFKHGTKTRRSERVKSCIPQLAATINDYFKAGIIAPKSVVLAIACVGFQEEFPPRSAQLEARQAQLNLLVGDDIVVELIVTDSTTFA